MGVFRFLFPGLWVMRSVFAEDKAAFPVSGGTRVLLVLQCVGTGLPPLCALNLLSLAGERCGRVVRYVMLLRLILGTWWTALLSCMGWCCNPIVCFCESYFCGEAGSSEVPEPEVCGSRESVFKAKRC